MKQVAKVGTHPAGTDGGLQALRRNCLWKLLQGKDQKVADEKGAKCDPQVANAARLQLPVALCGKGNQKQPEELSAFYP